MVKKLQDFFEEKDRFARLLGFKIVEIDKGYAKVEAIIKEQYLNGADVVHGGFLFSLADYAFAVASNSRNNLSLAINANILFHKSRSNGKIIAEAKELNDGKKIASYEVSIKDENDVLIASFSGSVFKKNISLIEI